MRENTNQQNSEYGHFPRTNGVIYVRTVLFLCLLSYAIFCLDIAIYLCMHCLLCAKSPVFLHTLLFL